MTTDLATLRAEYANHRDAALALGDSPAMFAQHAKSHANALHRQEIYAWADRCLGDHPGTTPSPRHFVAGARDRIAAIHQMKALGQWHAVLA